MNRYAGLITNDFANGQGVCVSFFVQGCPHHCPGCFNESAWLFTEGEPFQKHDYEYIKTKIKDNNMIRNFSILGGEPLHPLNRHEVYDVCTALKSEIPELKIYLWTGYTMDEITVDFPEILNTIDVLIDGKYEQNLRDITLKLRGSSNQNIWRKHSDGRFYKE